MLLREEQKRTPSHATLEPALDNISKLFIDPFKCDYRWRGGGGGGGGEGEPSNVMLEPSKHNTLNYILTL